MTRLNRAARRELVRAVSERYISATKAEKARILNEFVAITGYHRKHAIRILNLAGEADAGPMKTTRQRIYDEAVREALIVLWEASDRICGKRLKPLLPVLVSALERHGHLQLDETVRTKLFGISAATIDRLLAPTRLQVRGKRRRRRAPAVRSSIPIRTFNDWNDPPPGFMEADLVAHCGGNPAGSFAHTLTLTDIATGWTECVPLAVRQSSLVVDAVEHLRTTMPFALRGIDTDNGSEFVNETMLAFCVKHGLELTRARPRRKNDQAWVEQKNGSVVRRMVGYGRLEGIAAAASLSRLYASSRLFVNFFQPSFKLLEKQRVGARVTKRYHTPETPCGRLLASDSIDDAMKQRLRAIMVTLDPLRLLDEIRTVQQHLAGLGAGEHLHILPHRDADLDRFFSSLPTAWKGGEVRPTHQREPRPDRYWRTHKDPFEEVWQDILVWLESEPDRTAKELFQRLQSKYPGTFPNGQLRTLQRRVKGWRSAAAQRLVFTASSDGPDFGEGCGQ